MEELARVCGRSVSRVLLDAIQRGDRKVLHQLREPAIRFFHLLAELRFVRVPRPHRPWHNFAIFCCAKVLFREVCVMLSYGRSESVEEGGDRFVLRRMKTSFQGAMPLTINLLSDLTCSSILGVVAGQTGALAVRATSSEHDEISHYPAVWRPGCWQRHPRQDSGDDSQFLSLRVRRRFPQLESGQPHRKSVSRVFKSRPIGAGSHDD